MKRSYYSAKLETFLCTETRSILGEMSLNFDFELNDLQRNTWFFEIELLKNKLINVKEGHILFEYTIPRMGKRIDVVLLLQGIVFLIEFKVGEKHYTKEAYDQVYDYALDLKNFQKESHDKLIIPIVIATEAPYFDNQFILDEDKIYKPIFVNKDYIDEVISKIIEQNTEKSFDYSTWENSIYMPTPTIIEAAQALYSNHSVDEISRSDAGAQNLTKTTDEINRIISLCKNEHRKAIIFVTGVPGAGKTLVGLNLAASRQDFEKEERAIFLSGNGPLVEVLTEALARDKVQNAKIRGEKLNKSTALREANSLIQIIHRYRDNYIGNNDLPSERIAIFDESQRAWTVEMISKFMAQKKGVANFNYSEPEFLISTMNRFDDWAVIVCLVGGGQEINTGEAGLPEWFDSLRRSFIGWDVYASDQLNDIEYTRSKSITQLFELLNVTTSESLHLSTSMRSFRSEKLSEFIEAILDVDTNKAKTLYKQIHDKYPIFLTRDLTVAKELISKRARGTERFGIVASSGALRLKPYGIFVKNEISPSNWFLNDKNDIRSSYYLEDCASEFDIQGLELDYTIVAWDGDFRFNDGKWTYNRFCGTKWQNIESEERKCYLKNAYRVLLTRARQGMVIFIPMGSNFDDTRKKEYYDETYSYLKEIIKE